MVVLDAFAGSGGNTIQLANYFDSVVACDIDFPEELHDKFKKDPPCPENVVPKTVDERLPNRSNG